MMNSIKVKHIRYSFKIFLQKYTQYSKLAMSHTTFWYFISGIPFIPDMFMCSYYDVIIKLLFASGSSIANTHGVHSLRIHFLSQIHKHLNYRRICQSAHVSESIGVIHCDFSQDPSHYLPGSGFWQTFCYQESFGNRER